MGTKQYEKLMRTISSLITIMLIISITVFDTHDKRLLLVPLVWIALFVQSFTSWKLRIPIWTMGIELKEFFDDQSKANQHSILRLFIGCHIYCSFVFAVGLTIYALDVVRYISLMLHNGYNNDVRFFITPGYIIPGLAASMVSIIVVGLLLDKIIYLAVRNHIEEFREFASKRGAAKKRAKIKLIIVTLFVISLVSVALYSDTYLRVTNSGVGLNRLFELEERCFPWHNIKKVERVESFDTYKYILHFSDDSIWNTPDVKEVDRHQLDNAMQYINKQILIYREKGVPNNVK